MTRVLATFSGPNGDILWSMPTVRAIGQMVGEPKVDFACMPDYRNLLPLIQYQPYVGKAFVIEDWIRWHSNHGDQPWCPPRAIEQEYDRVFHLTYRFHPGLGGKALPLIDFTADQQGIKLKDPVPFLAVPLLTLWRDKELQEMTYGNRKFNFESHIAIAFNAQYQPEKTKFIEKILTLMPDTCFIDVTKLPWDDAALFIKNAVCFVGCRSSNYVLAHGVGQKNIFVYEPHPSRNKHGHLGNVFGCPYNEEVTPPWLAPPELCAEICAESIRKWKKETEDTVTDSAIFAER